MKLHDVFKSEITGSLITAYTQTDDKFMCVQEWLERTFDEFPAMTENPLFVDNAVEIIETRIELLINVIKRADA